MKRVILCVVAMFSLCYTSIAAAPQAIVSGHGNTNVSIVDLESCEILWQYPLNKAEKEFCNSMFYMEDRGLIAFTIQKGAKIVNLEKEVVWEYSVEEGSEAHCIIPTEKGGFAIVIAGNPARIVEFSKDFKQIKEISFDAMMPKVHGQFRQAMLAKNGNWLVPSFSKEALFEITRDGEMVETHSVGGGAFGITQRKNGNILLGFGDGHTMAEYDPKSKRVVREIAELKGEEVSLLYMAQVEEIEKGVFMVANWSGHNKKPITAPAPRLIQFNDNEEVIWTWEDDSENPLGMAAGFCYLKKGIIK